MVSSENKVKDIFGMIRTGMLFLLLQFLLNYFKGRLQPWMPNWVSMILILSAFGYINFRYNDTVAFLYNLNPISPAVSTRFVRFLGLFFLLLSLVFCVVLVIKIFVIRGGSG
jgi:hypothetical protein